MKNIFLLSIYLSSLFAVINRVPQDYSTIQAGIDATVDGDTVLVDEGIYYENLQINKEITLTSHYILEADTSYIYSTIIDGSNYNEDYGPFGSCVLFLPSENGDAIRPKLTGFTIQNGQGTRVRETITESDTTYISTYYMGGGLMIWHTLPEITYNYIRNNGGDSEIRAGRSRRGGGAALGNDDDVEFDEDRSVPYARTTLTRDDEIIFTNNIFENNNSDTGNTFESIGYVGDIDFSDSFFDVFSTEYEDVSDYWVFSGDANTDFTGGSGEVEAITQDVYVSPDGSDENDGLSEDTPFKHIDFALSQVFSDSINIRTINLSEGTFSPLLTGETFPIIILSNVNLVGESGELTILDAESNDENFNQVIYMVNSENNTISDLSITGGRAEGDYPYMGGGIYLYHSDPMLTNVNIYGNSAQRGGGVHLKYSNPTLTNVIISGNTATVSHGGGMSISGSDPILENVSITENYAMRSGGGVHDWGNSNPIFNNVTMSGNIAATGGIDGHGGGIYLQGGSLTNVTIIGNSASRAGGMRITGDATLSNVIISGNSGGWGGGIQMHGCNPILTNVTITENTSTAYGGGGILMMSSDPILTNVSISFNSAPSGGGMHVSNDSNPILTNVTIGDNTAGGIFIAIASNPILTNTIVWNNIPESIYLSSGGTAMITYSDIEGDTLWNGVGNINDNPLFCNSDSSDYLLAENSPCIGNGENGVNMGSFGIGCGEIYYGSLHVSTLGSDETGDGSAENPFATIQNAIDHEYITNGDTVFVSAGTYTENINFTGSNIVLMGEDLETTIIDGNQNGSVVTFSTSNGVGNSSILSGFTIKNGLEDKGAGINCYNSSPSISNMKIINNSASYGGGGIYLSGSDATLNNITISGNTVDSYGGGIYLSGSDATLNNIIISENTSDYNGGGMYCGSSDPSLVNITISGNSASNSGGGIYINTSAMPIISYVIINENTAAKGGGICLYNDSNPFITNVTISENIATSHGGGMYLNGSHPNLMGVTISENTSDYNGGGMSLNYSNPIVENVTISGNSANNLGGGMYISYSDPILTNVTISENSYRGIYLFNSHSVLTNSIIWGNVSSPINLGMNGTTVIHYSDIESDTLWAGEGNINEDPLFADSENGNHTLQEGSPCIDSGTADLDGDGVEDITDYIGLAPDMGAFEYSGPAGPSDIFVTYNTGWNIVGLPVEVEDASYQALFPNAQSNSLYSFDGVYQSQETLELGAGYLLRLTTDIPVTFTGTPISEITMSLSAGWNLFTGISSSLSVDDVYAQDIIQSGTIYGLDGVYFSPESIDPGMGYWVRATEDGEITLSSGASAKQVSFVNRAEEANSISFSNGVYSTKLYFGVDIPEEEILSYSLPPMFPEMAFDVRFVGDSRVVMESGEIEVLNTAETLTLSYDVPIEAGEQMNWVLTAKDGTDYILEGTGEITIPSAETFVLNRKPVIPISFALHQNYPNPFNPITTLRYDLPSDAMVTLSIYDMLGREITQLVNISQQAGFKLVHWDAKDSMGRAVSAGVYIYQIQADEFVQTKKMVLLK